MKLINRTAIFTVGLLATASTIADTNKAKEEAVWAMLAQNYPAETYLAEHENGVSVCVWNEDGVVYTTTSDDPRVDNECQPTLTPEQAAEIHRMFPD
jgi:predicted dithiol-disulfide oxidoreductase (DUF899 family)